MKKALETLSLRIIEGIGSVASLIIHTIFFVGIFALRLVGVAVTDILLLLTTLVSLEAIYLTILVQMTLNKHTKSLQEVRNEVEELQDDVEELIEE